LAELHDAVAQGDAIGVRRLANAFKASAEIFAATGVMAAASRLETMAQNQDLADAASVCAALKAGIEQLVPALRALAAEAAPANGH
jgi:Hpt domain-containing protein